MAMPHAIATLLLALAAGAVPAQAQDSPVVPGTIVIEGQADEARPADQTPIFIDAVERELLNANFLTLPNRGGSRYIARVAVTTSGRGEVAAAPRDNGPSASAGNWGVTVRLPTDKSRLSALIATELDVTILSRKDDQPVWRGRAVTVQPEGSKANDSATVATKLAGALFRRFPQSAEEPIAVP